MAIDITQPTNLNLLDPINFQFRIDRLPHVNYFIQSINIPSVSTGQADIPTPFIRMPMVGDHITYGLLSATFRLDEDFNNYIQIYNWIRAIGFPETFQENADWIRDQGKVPTNPHAAFYSDGTLVILTSQRNPNIEVNFRDMYPAFLSDVNFNTQEIEFNPLEATVSFNFRSFDIKKL